MDDGSAKGIQGQNCKENREGRQDCSAQGLINTQIDHVSEHMFGSFLTFSLIRSSTTMVSLIEYPMIVKARPESLW